MACRNGQQGPHAVVSLMFDSGLVVGEIARLVGHARSKVTETRTATSSGRPRQLAERERMRC
jgi:hypothetical protein